MRDVSRCTFASYKTYDVLDVVLTKEDIGYVRLTIKDVEDFFSHEPIRLESVVGGCIDQTLMKNSNGQYIRGKAVNNIVKYFLNFPETQKYTKAVLKMRGEYNE